MSAIYKAVVTNHGPALSTDPQRPQALDTIVNYRILDATNKPTGYAFSVRIPKENPTPQEVQQAIQQDYSKQKQLMNLEVSLV